MKSFLEWLVEMDERGVGSGGFNGNKPLMHARFFDSFIERARMKARAEGRPYAVVLMDTEDDGKRYGVVPEDEVDSPEFESFDGQVLHIVEPDGSFRV